MVHLATFQGLAHLVTWYLTMTASHGWGSSSQPCCQCPCRWSIWPPFKAWLTWSHDTLQWQPLMAGAAHHSLNVPVDGPSGHLSRPGSLGHMIPYNDSHSWLGQLITALLSWCLLITWFCLIPTWITNHIPSKTWDDLTYPFQISRVYWGMDK